jgi:NADH-quinone oxidoreductase subunit L
VPFLSGFFSKDEILYETFHEGHTILWLVGAIASLLTATYMFRLVFLTFHGERRHDAPSPEASAAQAAPAHPEEEEPAHDAHGAPAHGAAAHHDGHIHDAPPAMALVLIVLAIGSVLAGYIGVPHALGGHNALSTWLAPAFAAPAGAVADGAEAAGEEALSAEETALELTLMGVSSLIAIAGIGIAAFIWLKRREIADGLARSWGGLYRLLLNKYYVDELYDAVVVRPLVRLSQDGLWRGFDVRVVDAIVNGFGSMVAGGSTVLRRLQTGSVRAYAGSVFIGVVTILAYYLWR